jgi:glycosyltransferase involved in cell wall biosynthesis
VEIDLLARIPFREADTFRLLSIGTLLHLKGFDFGLRAFARFRTQFPKSEYWLIGDGAERGRLEHLARDLGVADQVKFWGTLPRSQVLEKLAECDVLLHPALHESGGWVAVEAMAAGRPVVGFDLAGTALQVTADTGVKVAAVTPRQAVEDFANALALLAGDPALRYRLGRAGRQRVAEQFNWEKKGDFLMKLYAKLVDRSEMLQPHVPTACPSPASSSGGWDVQRATHGRRDKV